MIEFWCRRSSTVDGRMWRVGSKSIVKLGNRERGCVSGGGRTCRSKEARDAIGGHRGVASNCEFLAVACGWSMCSWSTGG